MQLADFDYDLPEDLIAQHPPAVRGGSRLLHVEGLRLSDRSFGELPALIRPGDVLVMNDTRVIKARLFGEKQTGGKVEALVERVLDSHTALVQLRASKAPKIGGHILFAGQWEAEVIARHDDLFGLRFFTELDVYEVLERSGRLPLPPYIARTTDDPQLQSTDEDRYQTVYAQERGAVAAPTAGLHFTDAMLTALRAQGVQLVYLTLHVGAGTFQPVRVDNLADHKMHSERFEISPTAVADISAARARGGRIIAVGTTSMRALESAARSGPLSAQRGETDIFITPGFRFQIVDRLLTNFHLPKSTLLMLVSAFAGVDEIRHAYAHAVQKRYRFFSYGDAMLLEKQAVRIGNGDGPHTRTHLARTPT